MDVSVQELLDDEFHRRARDVLRFWIGVDYENLGRIKAGIHLFKMPDNYRTNTIKHSGWVMQGITKAPNLSPAMDHLKEAVAYLSSQLHRKGDLAGAARCALLLRHFFKDDLSGGTHDSFLHGDINKAMGEEQTDYLFRGVDFLNTLIDKKLHQGTADEADNGKAG